MAITNTTSTVQAIFSLHVVTAGSAIILLLAALALFGRQLAGGPGRPRRFMKFTRSTEKRHRYYLPASLTQMSQLLTRKIALWELKSSSSLVSSP